jgi:hypothetical protein
MSASIPHFDWAASLRQYAISEGEYLSQHQDVHIICTGAVVFNHEGRLLLVQRAKDEKAFPDAWVSLQSKRRGTVRRERAAPCPQLMCISADRAD